MQILPPEIQQKWRAMLAKNRPTRYGKFELVGATPTQAGTHKEQRVIVNVVDEDNRPLAGVDVAFAFSTAPSRIILLEDWEWHELPNPYKALITPTNGAGMAECIQGSGVKEGESGGMTVYIFEPETMSSDVVFGAGMLADHTGLELTFQRLRVGVQSTEGRLAGFEQRLKDLEQRVQQLEANG